MRKGEKAQFLIDYPYAYGELGCPPRVPGKALILATVELLDFIEEFRAVSLSAKAAQRIGRAKIQSKEFGEARSLLLMAQRLAPQEVSISRDLRNLEMEAISQELADLDIMYGPYH